MRSMYSLVVLSGTVLLAACGGGGGTAPQSLGSVAPPAGSGATPTPTPTHSFVAPTDPKTYEAIGAVQHFQYSTDSRNATLPDGSVIQNPNAQYNQLYAGDANTVRDSGITVTYNPRDAIFEVTIARPLGSVDTGGLRFQDPAHRTAFGGLAAPQAGVTELTKAGIQYLEVGTASGARLGTTGTYTSDTSRASDYVVGAPGYSATASTFFYQKPGTTTKYVTYAGFVRNTISAIETQDDATSPMYLRENYSLDRAAFVFGERTTNAAVPRSGRGDYSGDMIATMVFNNTIDTDARSPTYFQWVEGTHTTTIDFGTLKVDSSFTGLVRGPTRDAYTTGNGGLANGTSFYALSSATIDLVNKGGFTGQFGCAAFGTTCTSGQAAGGGVLLIAGSSIDGAFFGPNGEEIGGGFRIVGGKPDERIDILGAFTGKKP